MRALSVSVVLLFTAPVLADNTADEADIAFSRGVQAYTKRDYEAALSSYFLSYRLVPNRNVLFNIARCYEALDRPDEAYRYWHDLFVDPTLPADDRKDVKAALARLSPQVALVTVTATPTEGELFVDREDLGSRGKTPQTVAVKPGAHTVLVKAEGFRPAQAKVTAVKGREAKVTVELSRIVGAVELTGTPAGAVVRETADGPELGRLPATLTLPPGQRLFLVQAPGYLPQQVLVDVRADAQVSAKVSLPEKPKPTGKVIVTANRDAAVVRVDGKDSGFTPVVLNLTEGKHQLEITATDVAPFLQTVEVTADQELRIAADLRYAPPKVTAASKQLLSVDQAPASITVITREEIQAFGYQTLPEALRAVRGLFFTDDRIYTYIGIRGFTPPGDLNTRILILFDGHPVNDVWAGQGFSARDFDVDLAEVDRIEVVRGPASLLFGSGGFFGVINVVPRARLTNRNVEGVVGAGGVGGVKARVTGSLGNDEASAILSVAGFTATGAELTDLGTAGVVRGLDDERSIGANAKARWKGLSLTAKWNQRKKQVPTAPLGAAFGVPGTEYTDARGFAELRFEQEFASRFTLTARAAYDASRYRGYYAKVGDDGGSFRTTDIGGGDWFSAEVRGGLFLFDGNRLTLGVEGQAQLAYQQPEGFQAPQNTTRFFFSGTLMDEWQLWNNRLFLQAGVRVDKYNDVGEFALSPRGAVVARLYESGVTKLVAGRAFRAPTVYELSFSDGLATQRAPLPGTLTPEYITTFELEHSHNFTPELRASLGGYYNLIDRLVVLNQEESDPPACAGGARQCFVYSNTTRGLTALGAEAQLRWQPGRFTLVEGTYSFVMLGGPGGSDAPPYPQHLASARAMIPLKEGLVRLSSQATYQSGRRTSATATATGEALLLNFGLSGDYGPVRYFAGVQNLLDSRVLLPVQSEVSANLLPQYGRTFWLELSAGF
ncbi:MAG: PEGA domain-containing protein [Myxococcaceae bacterium]|nr:PEGA domain-containing protein [Myxococcaceae bacterium]